MRRYRGLGGVGGFISTEEVKGLVEKGSMNLLFSGSGFFGYFYSSSAAYAPDRDSAYSVSEPGESLGWWSTYSADECPDPKTLDMEAVASQLRERHGDWKDPVIRKIIGSLNVKSMYPTWTSPQLPTWERDGVVLVGDAAHALPSTSGQGSSQALEDAEAFAMLLGHAIHVVDQESSADTAAYKKAITTAAKQYIEIRRPRVQSILESAQRMQSTKRDMSWIAEYAMYCAMWIAGKSLITTIKLY
jgi:2-polyprenyl-6-methoxyphenol hydroxylase-like FAD-dependent oxidoreductase